MAAAKNLSGITFNSDNIVEILSSKSEYSNDEISRFIQHHRHELMEDDIPFLVFLIKVLLFIDAIPISPISNINRTKLQNLHDCLVRMNEFACDKVIILKAPATPVRKESTYSIRDPIPRNSITKAHLYIYKLLFNINWKVSHKQIQSKTCNCLTIKDIIKDILDPSKNENANLGTFSFSMTTPILSRNIPIQSSSMPMKKDERICPYGIHCTRLRPYTGTRNKHVHIEYISARSTSPRREESPTGYRSPRRGGLRKTRKHRK
jgi:hypothetical protein